MSNRYFVNDPPIPIYEFDPQEVVSDQPPNVIWIKPRMNVETKGKVTSEMFTMSKDAALEARLGSNDTALLLHNIVKWEGPDLGQIPCTPENIRNMDPTEPHIAKVLEELAVRNKKKKADDPNESTASSNTSAGDLLLTESVSPVSENGMSISPLRSAISGRTAKSDA